MLNQEQVIPNTSSLRCDKSIQTYISEISEHNPRALLRKSLSNNFDFLNIAQVVVFRNPNALRKIEKVNCNNQTGCSFTYDLVSDLVIRNHR